MLNLYQHIPEFINSVVFSIGNFSVRWYSLMYLVALGVVYGLLTYRIKKGEGGIIQDDKVKLKVFKNSGLEKSKFIQNSIVIDFLSYSFIGLIIGARLGYVFFYNLDYFIQNPLAVISPFDSKGRFIGIFGMSYYGGLIGAIASSWIFSRKNRISFLKWADFAVPAIPAGYLFGRLGNFLNGELYGKATDYFWGMYFSGNFFLSHPTQLYEAFLEGVVLFAILWILRNKSKFPGQLLFLYLFGYGLFRFFIEFLREPEGGLISGLTTGQVFSLVLIIFSTTSYLIAYNIIHRPEKNVI